jgi:hypothetical protein
MKGGSEKTTNMKDNEGSTVAGGEGRNRLQDTVFSSWSLRSVTSQEVVASLLGGELGHGRKDTKGIAGQHDNVAWLSVGYTRNPGIGNKLDGVSATSILGDADIIVIGCTG